MAAYSPPDSGRPAGMFVGTADATSPRRGLMVVTLVLSGRGDLALQGPLDFEASRSGTLAVLGGTGEFEGASGSVAVVSHRREQVTLTARLAG